MAVVSNNSHVEGCHLNCKMEAEEVREVYHRLTGSTMSHFDAERTVRRSSDAEVNNGFPEVKNAVCMSIYDATVSSSIIGALSIISSAVYRKTACNPRVCLICTLWYSNIILSRFTQYLSCQLLTLC